MLYRLKQRVHYAVVMVLNSNRMTRKILSRWRQYKKKEARKALQENGIATTESFIDSASRCGINVFPLFGSLLGIVRDCSYMQHDDDIDMGVIVDESFEWDEFIKFMELKGFKPIRSFGFDNCITECTFYSKSIEIDVFGLFPQTNGKLRAFLYRLNDGVVHDNYDERSVLFMDIPIISEYIPIQVQSSLISIPKNFDDLLTTMYGNGWRIPDPTWQTGTGWTRIKDTTGYKITID